VKHKECARRPKLVKNAEFKAPLDEDPYHMQEELAKSLSCSISHFHAFKNIGNDLKARKLNTV